MGFETKRIEAARTTDSPRIKRWIARHDPAVGRLRRKRWLLRQRLIAKAQEADRGRTIDTRGMSDDQFLALLRR